MELRKFRIRYAILVNGEEYPNSADFNAITAEQAEHQLKALLKPDVNYIIHDVTPL